MAKKIEGILTNMDNGPGCELGDGAGWCDFWEGKERTFFDKRQSNATLIDWGRSKHCAKEDRNAQEKTLIQHGKEEALPTGQDREDADPGSRTEHRPTQVRGCHTRRISCAP